MENFFSKLKKKRCLSKVRKLCADKTDVERYERLARDDAFIAKSENIDALMQVMVEDNDLWGGSLLTVFLPTEDDEEFEFGFGVNVAYNTTVQFLDCGINESNPVISWIRHFFENRTDNKQKIDAFCLCVLRTSLLPLYTSEDVKDLEKFFEVAEIVNKLIPCCAWGNFLDDFSPYYKALVDEYSLVNAFDK